MEWDPGPPAGIAAIFEKAPLNKYKNKPDRFRLEWGPIYYRGRLDGSARILVIGQDPAADENVARRILVGDAGQRVQGFLSKLGITRSYVMVNSSLYSITGQFDDEIKSVIDTKSIVQWRNQLLDELLTPKIQAVLAFGNAAKYVVDTWPGADALRQKSGVFHLMHPTARPSSKVLLDWNSKLAEIAARVTPDKDSTANVSPYTGTEFKTSDLARVPLYDFSFGVPSWMGTGDMAVRRAISGKKTIVWTALSNKG